MKDFTISIYKNLLNTLKDQQFHFQTFREFIEKPGSKVIILRHDVDKLSQNALRFAQIEYESRIQGTYYFRIVPQSFDEKIIEEIAGMGHEIGYHYEDLDLVVKRYKKQDTRNKLKVKSSPCETATSLLLLRRVSRGEPCEMRSNFASKIISQGKKSKVKSKNQQQATSTQYPVPSTQHPAPPVKYAPLSHFTWQASTQKEDLYDLAIKSFQRNLETLRKIAPVKTICMHGSPMGRYDNRDLWKKYDYRDFGIIGEPYFDVDFSQVLYLTDTGRRWDGEKVSIRDKIRLTAKYAKSSQRSQSKESPQSTVDSQQYEDSKKIKSLNEKLGLEFKSTFDIIKAAEKGELPDRIMITFHPQRWTDGYLPWIKEFILQNLKNVVKRTLISIRK